MGIGTEIAVIVALTLANGLFAGAEIAILSVRKTRLRELADEGSRAAEALVTMRDQPERFLATVQIGITVVGATTAAFGGATLARAIAALFARLGWSPEIAEDVALAMVIGLISYLSLVLGELVPKSLALRKAERYALAVARLLLALSWLARPLVWFLTMSSNLVLRVFRDKTTFTEARLSKEELQQLVEEAATAGALDAHTGEIAYRALAFGDVRVAALMVPRADMITLARDATKDDARRFLLQHVHSRVPIHEGSQDNIVGYVTSRDLLALVATENEKEVGDLVRTVLFVPERMRAVNVLHDMRQKRDQLAMVVDDEGVVSGLVTLEDLIEELVGEIFAEHETPVERIRKQADGTALVRGRIPVHEVNRELGIELPESPDWVTMGGLAMALAEGIPQIGMQLQAAPGVTLEIVEATERRVLSVRVRTTRPSTRASRRPPA
jgi:putative hemolysin